MVAIQIEHQGLGTIKCRYSLNKIMQKWAILVLQLVNIRVKLLTTSMLIRFPFTGANDKLEAVTV
jgi:hypothetical protein